MHLESLNHLECYKQWHVCCSSPYIQQGSEKAPDVVPSEEPCETVCGIVVAAGVTVESTDLDVPPQTVEDSVVTVPSSKTDSIDKQSALTLKIEEQSSLTSNIYVQSASVSEIYEQSVLPSKVDEQSTLSSKPNTPSGNKFPPHSEMTVMQGHATTASPPSSVLLAKHWGPERMVEILREPNCSLGISIVGGKVRCNSMKETIEETP